MDILSDLILVIQAIMGPLLIMPGSTVFIVIVGAGINIVSIYATKRLVDMEEVREITAVVKEWQEKFKKARKTGDAILMEEVMAQQGRVMALQGKLASMQMKPMCYTYIPILIVFFLLSAVYGALPVAILPFNIQRAFPFLNNWVGKEIAGVGFGLYYWTLYVLASFPLGGILRKIFGVEMQQYKPV